MRSSFGVITTSPGCSAREQRGALRPLAERLRAGDAALDEHLARRVEAVHLGVAGDGALLDIEALALVGLHDGGDPGVAVDAAGCRGRGLPGGELALGRRVEMAGEAGVAYAHRAAGLGGGHRSASRPLMQHGGDLGTWAPIAVICAVELPIVLPQRSLPAAPR